MPDPTDAEKIVAAILTQCYLAAWAASDPEGFSKTAKPQPLLLVRKTYDGVLDEMSKE